MADTNDFNKQIIDEFRANDGKVGGPFEGLPMVLVTHTGAKSGTFRTTPLVPLLVDDDLVIFASKAGADTNPGWYHNLVANPRVTVEFGTDRFEADARIAEGDERDQLYAKQADLFPQFGDYEQKTDRIIPVIVLDRA